MPTKSGRIKVEDMRQGKTIWVAFRVNASDPYVPKPYLVVEGAKWRFAGIRWDGNSPTGESYSYLAFAIDDRYSGKDDSGQYKSVMISYFHTERNGKIQELPDGSHVYSKAFTTRRRCQRYCDELNRGDNQRYGERVLTDADSTLTLVQGFSSIGNVQSVPYVKHPGPDVAPIAPW